MIIKVEIYGTRKTDVEVLEDWGDRLSVRILEGKWKGKCILIRKGG